MIFRHHSCATVATVENLPSGSLQCVCCYPFKIAQSPGQKRPSLFNCYCYFTAVVVLQFAFWQTRPPFVLNTSSKEKTERSRNKESLAWPEDKDSSFIFTAV
jgi:hypothetical protein